MMLKICGMTRVEDVRCAAEAGVDFIGAIIVPGSKRQVTPEQAAVLFQAAAPAKGVLVVRDMELEPLQALIDELRPYAVQLHGGEPPEYARALTGAHVWKACNLRSENDLQQMLNYPAEILVADSGGGTGRTCDWTLAARLAKIRPVFLAGGITVDNIQEAIAAVQPAGIDIAGGAELSPGLKDHAKIKQLCGRRLGAHTTNAT
ncbi:MAG: phosphoribosylanthranilate isomerase [Victivallales bacterium]|nr:phosphoribosylanthranilate isomerase [Victivallales bacterium]